MTRILITRHGEGEHNLETEFFMGRAPDAQLTELGREQARRLGARLAREAPPERIICSSLPRTVETARLIAGEIGIGEVEKNDDFWELSKGEWEGRMPRQLPPDIAKSVAQDPFGYKYPGGESYREVWERVGPAFDRFISQTGGGTILFVLHGDVIRALLYHIVGFPPERIGDWETRPCAIFEFNDVGEGPLHIVRINDFAHLP